MGLVDLTVCVVGFSAADTDNLYVNPTTNIASNVRHTTSTFFNFLIISPLRLLPLPFQYTLATHKPLIFFDSYTLRTRYYIKPSRLFLREHQIKQSH